MLPRTSDPHTARAALRIDTLVISQKKPATVCNCVQLCAIVCNYLQLSAEVCNRLQLPAVPLRQKAPTAYGDRGRHADANQLFNYIAARPTPALAVAMPTISTQSRADDISEWTDLTDTPSVPAISCSVRSSQ